MLWPYSPRAHAHCLIDRKAAQLAKLLRDRQISVCGYLRICVKGRLVEERSRCVPDALRRQPQLAHDFRRQVSVIAHETNQRQARIQHSSAEATSFPLTLL